LASNGIVSLLSNHPHEEATILFILLFAVNYCFAQPADKPRRINECLCKKLIEFNGSVLVEKNGGYSPDKGYGYRDAASKTINDEKTISNWVPLPNNLLPAVIFLRLRKKEISGFG